MADAPSFADVFAAAYGTRPFPWQQRLCDELLAGRWPEVIDVPTGLGKTVVLDAALYALARQADLEPHQRTARTRVALVIDRRIVVDSAFERARRLAGQLEAASTGPLRWLRDQLLKIGGSGTPLVVTRMRGGVSWSTRWVERPDQPAILVATVDQVGSRFLFRGYGTSERWRPIDAGLLGSDTVIVLDEAHLSDACRETIVSCIEMDAAAERPLPGRPTVLVEMSATPRRSAGSSPLVTAADHDDLVAARRLEAVRRASLLRVESRSTKSAGAETAAVMAGAALSLLGGQPRSIGVVANTIARAREIFDTVSARGVPTALVIGRCRPYDRDVAKQDWLERLGTRSAAAAERGPFVLVATQTIEVGVDIDLDALVTEAAPIDALVQRFGRVDRGGVLGVTDSVIVGHPGLLGDDPVYGEASASTWAWLENAAGGSTVVAPKSVELIVPGEHVVDMAPLAVREQLAGGGSLVDLMAQRLPPPVVLPATIAVWRRTSPVPAYDEAVAPYLHGVARVDATVSIGWRVGIDSGDDPAAALARIPPVDAELVEVPLAAARRFLARQSGTVADVDGVDPNAEADAADEAKHVRPHGDPVRALVRRQDEWVTLRAPSALRPGDVVVLDVDAGGHDAFGWTGRHDPPVIDIGGIAVAHPRSRVVTIRLDPQFLRPHVATDEWSAVDEAVRRYRDLSISDERFDLDLDAELEVVVDLLRSSGGAIAEALAESSGSPIVSAWLDGDETIARELMWSRRGVDVDDGDAAASSTSRREVALDAHLRSVGSRCHEIGERLGLGTELLAAVRLAGRFHDLGKAEPRFQQLLRGGLPTGAGADAAGLLAKSRARSARERARAAVQAGWPAGLRHEAVSLALVRAASPDVFDGVDRDLVEHLVASHHGYARPFFPAVDDPGGAPVSVSFEGLDLAGVSAGVHRPADGADRLERLSERYGTWGLSLLEAIVRLADIAVSEEGG